MASGATANGLTISSGGTLEVLSGALVSGTIVSSGGLETVEGVMLFADGSREEIARMTKREMADRILDLIRPRLKS